MNLKSRKCISKASRRPGKTGGREGGEADFGLLCSPETLSRWHPSMDTEAEAIQSSPRFFLVSDRVGEIEEAAGFTPKRKSKTAERKLRDCPVCLRVTIAVIRKVPRPVSDDFCEECGSCFLHGGKHYF